MLEEQYKRALSIAQIYGDHRRIRAAVMLAEHADIARYNNDLLDALIMSTATDPYLFDQSTIGNYSALALTNNAWAEIQKRHGRVDLLSINADFNTVSLYNLAISSAQSINRKAVEAPEGYRALTKEETITNLVNGILSWNSTNLEIGTENFFNFSIYGFEKIDDEHHRGFMATPFSDKINHYVFVYGTPELESVKDDALEWLEQFKHINHLIT